MSRVHPQVRTTPRTRAEIAFSAACVSALYFRNYRDHSEASSCDLLRRLQRTAPTKIIKLLTDNGSQFTDRFTSRLSGNAWTGGKWLKIRGAIKALNQAGAAGLAQISRHVKSLAGLDRGNHPVLHAEKKFPV